MHRHPCCSHRKVAMPKILKGTQTSGATNDGLDRLTTLAIPLYVQQNLRDLRASQNLELDPEYGIR
jgi:hypothetical protein